MKLILLESYEADLSNSGYNIQFGEELTEIQTNLYSVCKHSDTVPVAQPYNLKH